MKFDLVIANGTLIDPSQGVARRCDVGVKEGRVAQIGERLPTDQASSTIDAQGMYVTPGLVDLHAHCYWGGNPGGINADKIGPATGVTTWVDTGSTGAGNFEGFYYHVIKRSTVRILPLLNISHVGTLLGAGLVLNGGELFDFRFANLHEIIRVGEKFRDAICGVKVRASVNATGPNSLDALRIARAAGDALELPVMVHVGPPPPFIEDVLDQLKEGDIVTHCFTPYHGGIVDHRLRIKDAVRDARERGVLFDVAHGAGSFSFEVAEAALMQDFPPDTISTDLHARNLNGPVHDLPTTMSKFLALGMELEEVIARATHVPAKAIGAQGAGSLSVGNPADIAVLSADAGEFPMLDSQAERRLGAIRLSAAITLVAGERVEPVQDDRNEESARSNFPAVRSYRP
ncbi:MAG: amidohydrolase/deacetylase family metallohydrolase [Trueperaceae bacterium]